MSFSSCPLLSHLIAQRHQLGDAARNVITLHARAAADVHLCPRRVLADVFRRNAAVQLDFRVQSARINHFPQLADFALRNIRWFRQLYFIGGNPNSAELTGINVKKMRLIMFGFSGFMAALAGCFSASRLQGSVPTNNAGTAMKLMVACVIGGSSFSGGRGSMLGSALGLVFLTILNNGMIMLKISDYWFNCVLGIFLIAVVFINTLSASSIERNKAKQIKKETIALMNEHK